jgi:hypothetical protein
MKRLYLTLPIMLLLSPFQISPALSTPAITSCEKVLLVTVGNHENVYKLNDKSALFYRADLNIDADGSPRAYHPTNDKDALDYKANGYPWGVVLLRKKPPIQPYIQNQDDPAPGFYVSTTSLEDTTKKETDPSRYVNSEKIPYIVLPPSVMKSGGVKKGDLAVVINKKNGKSSYAIFADVGPKTKIGEGSIALAKNLEINKNPKTGGPTADVIYVVFPSSGDGKLKSLDEINGKGAELFTAWGGIEQVTTCFPK